MFKLMKKSDGIKARYAEQIRFGIDLAREDYESGAVRTEFLTTELEHRAYHEYTRRRFRREAPTRRAAKDRQMLINRRRGYDRTTA